MNTLTKPELIERLRAIKGATFVTVETETMPKATKPVVKRSKVNGMVGANYTNSVNNQRDREGLERNFKANPRIWGQNVDPFFVELKNKKYLKLKVEKTELPQYFLNGQRLSQEAAEKLLAKKSDSNRQGVERPVIVRNYSVDNIVRITMNGETFDIV